MTLQDLKNKKNAVVGLGVNNRHLAEYFKAKEIKFDVLDGWKSPDDLIGRLNDFEIIFRTPGLPYLCKAIQQAKHKGVVIYSQTKLFFDLCPCPIIGVTGSKGKGTTATLISKFLEATGKKAWLAGNIGQDPFEFLDKINPEDLVVLELSSFQLQDMHKSPHVAVVLKITPEHLDYHKNVEEYIDAKKPIVFYQKDTDFAIVNYDYETTRKFAPLSSGTVIWNSTMQEVKTGCYVKGERIMMNSPLPQSPPSSGEGEEAVEIMPISEVKLIGRFNLENVTAAIAASAAAGVNDASSIRSVVGQFIGLPHRLELVAEVKGVKFFNDSFSTTPETAMAAISAFDAPIILILGGYEKNADYAGLARTVAGSKIKALVPIGTTGSKIAKLARKQGFEGRIIDDNLESMERIVSAANALAQSGDVVLLSPASASFDMFKDYKHRGELFKKFVKRLL